MCVLGFYGEQKALLGIYTCMVYMVSGCKIPIMWWLYMQWLKAWVYCWPWWFISHGAFNVKHHPDHACVDGHSPLIHVRCRTKETSEGKILDLHITWWILKGQSYHLGWAIMTLCMQITNFGNYVKGYFLNATILQSKRHSCISTYITGTEWKVYGFGFIWGGFILFLLAYIISWPS